MSRTVVPCLMLAALSGCFVITDQGYEPVAPAAKADPTRSAWLKADGTSTAMTAPKSAIVSQPATPKPAGDAPAAAAAPKCDVAGGSIDHALVKATYVETPRAVSNKAATESPSALPPAPLPAVTTTLASGPNNPTTLRLVNSRRIAFHFEVKDPGASGVVHVEVWGTQDMKTWKKFDAVAQKGKTYVIEVKDEGLYGFTLLAHGGNGAGKDRPQPGEAPQVWVAVDYTRPAVQFVGAELNILARTPTLVIRWSAADKNLGPRPVSLFYAEQSQGPWTLLASTIENSGRYEWALPATLPHSLFLRVQAADLMGNVGMAETPNLLAQLQPGSMTASLVHAAPAAPAALPPAPPPPTLEALPKAKLDLLNLPPPAEPIPARVNIVNVEADRNQQ